MNMKYTGTETSGADKKVYSFTVGKEELEILTKLTEEAFERTPKVFEIMQYRARLRNIAKGFGRVWVETVKGKKLPTIKGSRFHKRIKDNL